jgi:hypothetical protein
LRRCWRITKNYIQIANWVTQKFGITLELLQWKAANGITDKGFEELLGVIKNMRPEGNELGNKSNMHIPDNEIRKANFTVLQNSSLVAPYMEEHMNIVPSENPGKSETLITCDHIDTFVVWLR